MRPSGTGASGVVSRGYIVDDLIIDVGQQRIWRGGTELKLPQLSLEFLIALVRAAPNVVTFDSLVESVWSGSIVSPETVTQRVKLLREALGDDPHTPRYIGAVRAGAGISAARGRRPSRDAARRRLGSPPGRIRRPGQCSPLAYGSLVAVVVLVVGGLTAHIQARKSLEPQYTPAVVKGPITIAVLPFVDLSSEKSNEFLADGISEELLSVLANVENVRVTGRTSSFRFKGRNEDLRTIGRQLGVQHVIEGSVRKHEDDLRITARLVDASDGYDVWSRTFDRKFRDVLDIQSEIAREVVLT